MGAIRGAFYEGVGTSAGMMSNASSVLVGMMNNYIPRYAESSCCSCGCFVPIMWGAGRFFDSMRQSLVSLVKSVVMLPFDIIRLVFTRGVCREFAKGFFHKIGTITGNLLALAISIAGIFNVTLATKWTFGVMRWSYQKWREHTDNASGLAYNIFSHVILPFSRFLLATGGYDANRYRALANQVTLLASSAEMRENLTGSAERAAILIDTLRAEGLLGQVRAHELGETLVQIGTMIRGR